MCIRDRMIGEVTEKSAMVTKERLLIVPELKKALRGELSEEDITQEVSDENQTDW